MPDRPRYSVTKRAADHLTAGINSPPIPVRRIAEKQGVDVVFADFGKHSDTVAGFCDFARKKLYVNGDERTERQSFTIAHELGHWMLHRGLFAAHPELYPALPRRSDPNRGCTLEKEANHFAAHLLVPDRLLKPVLHAPAETLAPAFGVSVMMMGFRLTNAKR
ncbi:hypothetical protein RSWS8N_15704 [Cereibacter sphaeroides WS8N]|nr:hypothetical protein RSWS8N_15704 [Cereibacter sphaeroides WS8N]